MQLARCYAGRVGFGPMDQVVIACSHRAFTTIGSCWRGPQYLLRSGPDGADLVLLAVTRHDYIAARFPRVVIASGDHTFTRAVLDLAAAGCHVTVASRRDRLSHGLELAVGGRVIYLDPPGHPRRPGGGRTAGSATRIEATPTAGPGAVSVPCGGITDSGWLMSSHSKKFERFPRPLGGLNIGLGDQ